MTSDGSGQTLPGSSLVWDPASSSWRTSPSLFEPGFLTSSPTLPEAGSMRSGVVSRQPMLAPRTTATASGSWDGATTTNSLTWGTPTARQDSKSPEAALAAKQEMGREALTTLRTQVLAWATPTSRDDRGGTLTHTKGGSDLSSQAQTWPTPTVNGNNNRSELSDKAGDGLRTAALSWPTPKGRDERTHQGQGSRHDPDLGFAASRHPLTTSGDGEPGSEPVDLNPRFVEALMGVPQGWLTPSISVGTDSFRQWQQLHSSPSGPAPRRSRRATPSQPSLWSMHPES